jgi:hypothetical protein
VTARPARAAVLASLGFTLIALQAPPSHAATTDGRVAAVVLVDGPTFEQFMAAPGFQAIARAGGAAVLSARTVDGDEGPGHELTLGTGVRSAVPFPEVHVEEGADGEVVVRDFDAIVEANRDRSEPGLLGSVLESNGLTACAFGAPSALVAMNREGTTAATDGCDVRVYDFDLSARAGDPKEMRLALERLSGSIAFLVPDAPRVMIAVLSPAPSAEMDAARDELPPIALAEGPPAQVLGTQGDMHTLTSDTTRRTGVVSNEDLAPTILRFFDVDVPSEMHGEQISVVAGAQPPFALHRKHLQNRTIGTPVALMALGWVVLAGVLPVLLIWQRRRVPRLVGRAGAILPLTAASIGIALLSAGRLGSQTYANAVPFVLAVTVILAALALELRRFGTLAPAVGMGIAVLAYLVVDALQGWPDTPFTLLGGTALDGARFYGLPNNATGLLLGASLWIAAALRPWTGFALLVGVGLFAGFPQLGADLGGALTMFVAAGLWWSLATDGRLRWRGIGLTVATAAAGMAAVLAAQVLLRSSPTHGTRFVEQGAGGGIVHLALERLGTGARLLIDSPLSWLIVVGLPVALYFALRPPPVVRAELERFPRWRAAVLTTLLAGIVAYVVNDTGVAAAGFAFGLGAAGLLYLPMIEGPWWNERTDGRPAPLAEART